MKDRHALHVLLVLALAGQVTGCSQQASDPATTADTATASGGPIEARWLPSSQNGELPRSLHGFTLLDPAPEGAVPLGDGSRPAATELRVPAADGELRVLSFEGRIYRIEHIPRAAVQPERAAAIARERYGEPSEDSGAWVQFGRGLGEDDVLLGVSLRHPLLFIESPGLALAVYRSR